MGRGRPQVAYSCRTIRDARSRGVSVGHSRRPLPCLPRPASKAGRRASSRRPSFWRPTPTCEEGPGHLFVTGRAGTGKSTLLTCLKDLIADEMVILAPTGLAAVNVGGQTIHSFFGFPPRLIRPDDIRRSRNGRLMRRLKFLVIDEVSMVRSDLMWAIDQSLRVNRGRPREPFGGVRLALFGDLHQLPPVINDAEVAEHLESRLRRPLLLQSSPALREGAGTALIELSAGVPPARRGAARRPQQDPRGRRRRRGPRRCSTAACIRSAPCRTASPT